jgi:hypothetical protein
MGVTPVLFDTKSAGREPFSGTRWTDILAPEPRRLRRHHIHICGP